MITLKYLRDLYEQEKRSQKIQKIDNKFFEEVEEFFSIKKKLMKKSNLKAFQIAKEVENFRMLLRMFFEKREQKIISLALKSLRAGIKADLEAMLPGEQQFFLKLLELLKENEKNINRMIESGNIFDVASITLTSSPQIKDTNEQSDEREKIMPQDEQIETNISKSPFNEAEKTTKENNSNYLSIYILEHVPSFLGENYEFYGPYDEGEKVVLPREIAEVLIKLGKARNTKE